MLCHVFWSQVEYKIVCFIIIIIVNMERRKNDCVLNENDIVVLIADNNSDEIVNTYYLKIFCCLTKMTLSPLSH